MISNKLRIELIFLFSIFCLVQGVARTGLLQGLSLNLRVWFGGGDVASPAERLHGQIGFATLEPADANLNK